MTLREKILLEDFSGHSQADQRMLRSNAVVQGIAQNLEVNDWHLYPFYTVAFIEGFLSGAKHKLGHHDLALAHAYWQAILDKRLAKHSVTVENNARKLVDSMRSLYGF